MLFTVTSTALKVIAAYRKSKLQDQVTTATVLSLCHPPFHCFLFVSFVGNLGIFRPELFVFPESDSAVSDNGKAEYPKISRCAKNDYFLIFRDNPRNLLKLSSCCISGSVRTGCRSASLLMWWPYQEQLLLFLSLVSIIVFLDIKVFFNSNL